MHGTTKKISIGGKTQTIKIPKGVNSGSRIRFGDYDIVLEVNPDDMVRASPFILKITDT